MDSPLGAVSFIFFCKMPQPRKVGKHCSNVLLTFGPIDRCAAILASLSHCPFHFKLKAAQCYAGLSRRRSQPATAV